MAETAVEMNQNPNEVNKNIEEKKRSLKDALNEILEFFKKLVGIFKNNSIIERMEKIQQQIDDLAASGDLTEEHLDELHDLVADMAGKLKSVSHDDLEQCVNQWFDKIEGKGFSFGNKRTIDGVNLDINKVAILSKDKNMSLDSKIKELLNSIGIHVDEESFERTFNSRAKIINDGRLENEDILLIEFDHHIFEVKFLLNGKEADNIISFSNKKFEDIYGKDGTLKTGYSYIEKSNNDAEYDLMTTFCKKHNLNFYRTEDELREYMISKLKDSIDDNNKFFLARKNKEFSTYNGRILSTYLTSDGSFRIRDSVTGYMLVFKNNNSSINVSLFKNTKNFDVTGKEIPLGSIIDDGKGALHSRFHTAFNDPDANALLRCSETKTWLELHGVSEEQQKRIFVRNVDWRKVNQRGMENVNKIMNSCFELKDKFGLDYDVKIQQIKCNKDKSFTSLNIYDNDNRISLTFDVNGNPVSISYREAGKDSKTKSVYNIMTKVTSDDYFEKYADNIEFQKLFIFARIAIKEGNEQDLVKRLESLLGRNLDYRPEDKTKESVTKEMAMELKTIDKVTEQNTKDKTAVPIISKPSRVTERGK